MKRYLTLLFFMLAITWMATTARAGFENGFWIDDVRVTAKIQSSSVEFGFNGSNRYVRLDGFNTKFARFPSSSLSYEASYSGSGRTQWVAFDFIGNNFFGPGVTPSPVIQGGAHLIFFLRNATFLNSTNTEVLNAEGKGIFLGRNNTWGDCGSPIDKARIFFETRVVRSQFPSTAAAGVKCADWFPDKYFVDNQQYHIEMHVNDTHIAYWIYLKFSNGSTTLWSSNVTEALDYPASTAINSEFALAKSDWLLPDYNRMNNNDINNLGIGLALENSNNGVWSLKITNLNSSKF